MVFYLCFWLRSCWTELWGIHKHRTAFISIQNILKHEEVYVMYIKKYKEVYGYIIHNYKLYGKHLQTFKSIDIFPVWKISGCVLSSCESPFCTIIKANTNHFGLFGYFGKLGGNRSAQPSGQEAQLRNTEGYYICCFVKS